MLFNTLQFAIFFAVVLTVYRALPPRGRNGWLLLTSLLFYGLWVPAYLVLLAVDVVVNHTLLRLIARGLYPRLYLAASVCFTFGLLAYFKYAAFLLETAAPLLGSGTDLGFLYPVLPIGISFYSFQIVALAVDTYRRQAVSVPPLARYALFIAFFPQLIAGPILRGGEFLPQLERGGAVDGRSTRRGLWLIAVGVVKKVVLADFLMAPYADKFFAMPQLGTTPELIVATYSFAFQIYFDFSGYTDMARGMARLLGFRLPLNFSEPYLARSPAEYWQRWHMTLSRWLRDYLYISLGGNRHGNLRTFANILVTMLLGGLWHGAGWTYVVWGGLHGVLLVLYRLRGGDRPDAERPFVIGDVLRVAVTFHAICLLYIFFRAPTMADAAAYLSTLVSAGYWWDWPVLQTWMVVLCALLHVVERHVRLRLDAIQDAFTRAPWGAPAEGLVLGVVVGLAIAVAGAGGEFIYFQF